MTYYMWISFLIFIFISLAIDLGFFHKENKAPTFTDAIKMTSAWVILAAIFATVLYVFKGQESSIAFTTGYLVELSLSIDNVFVFILIFRYFKVPIECQHRVLFWGVLGAIVMRFIMIFVGVYLVTKFEWVFYIFGAFLIFSAYKLLVSKNPNAELSEENGVVSFLRKHLNISKDFYGDKFIILNENGKRVFTPLFLVLILIEQTDLVFALDSIPAILAITQDPFLVFSSNIFAILGLRSLYFVLGSIIEKFVYLHYALAVILGYVGAKMILVGFGIKIPMLLSLLVIFGSLGIAILASALRTRNKTAD